ncbi:hypothetical protein B0H16DRAFT_1902478 [Mycena metata]|uniref:Uncharacterized protein n=1 Tax=Mycena metata TaxID=1033252 RepID=A0AAD7GR74_9AGAR|nr:hypothetical protein B0H16DRAFT_1902478 [Mycena metata]
MSTQRHSLVSPYQHDRTSTARTSPQPQPQPIPASSPSPAVSTPLVGPRRASPPPPPPGPPTQQHEQQQHAPPAHYAYDMQPRRVHVRPAPARPDPPAVRAPPAPDQHRYDPHAPHQPYPPPYPACGLFQRTHSRPRPEQFPHKCGLLVASILPAGQGVSRLSRFYLLPPVLRAPTSAAASSGALGPYRGRLSLHVPFPVLRLRLRLRLRCSSFLLLPSLRACESFAGFFLLLALTSSSSSLPLLREDEVAFPVFFFFADLPFRDWPLWDGCTRLQLAAYAYTSRRRRVQWWRVRCSERRMILRVLVFVAGCSWARVLVGLVCLRVSYHIRVRCSADAGALELFIRAVRMPTPDVPPSFPPLHFRLAALSLAASSPSFLEAFFSLLPSCAGRDADAAHGTHARTCRDDVARYVHARRSRVDGDDARGRRTCGQGGDVHRAARTGTGTTPLRPLVGLVIRAVEGAFFFRAHLLCLVLPLLERTPHAAQMERVGGAGRGGFCALSAVGHCGRRRE